MNQDIIDYNQKQAEDKRPICEALSELINENLEGATNKLWHGAPVWFINDNPVAGYAALKDSVQLLFWSGQSFDEPGLEPEGTFKAAQKRFTATDQVNHADLKRWLKKAQEIQWDYKNIVKNKGVLNRLTQ